MKFKLGIGFAAVFLTSLAFGTIDAYTFKSTPKEGDVLKYKQAAKLDLNGMEIDFSATSTRKIVKVDAAGTFTVKEDLADMKVNGQEPPEGAGPSGSTMTFTNKGELVKLEGDHVDDSAYRTSNLELFVLPDKPVNPNDTWSYEFKENKTTGAVAGKATYTFIGDDKVGTVDVVKVKYLVKETGDSGASSEGFIWIRKADGAMVKLTSKWVNVPIAGAGPISGDVTVTLIQ
jgi:hypothetical protein